MRYEDRRAHLTRLAGLGLSAIGLTGCTVSRPSAAPTPNPPTSRNRVRVGLWDGEAGTTLRVGAAGRVVATTGGRAAVTLEHGEAVSVTPSGDGVEVMGGGQARWYGMLRFRAASTSGGVVVDGRTYRGDVTVRGRAGGLIVVNDVGVEDYVRGVVAAEMGGLAEGASAALEAQAIAARTYLAANRGRFEARGYDVRAGVSDQAYRGVEGETPEIATAVRATAGTILTYQGRPAAVFYHSTCGFATAAPEEAFRDVRPHPYLQSISDASGSGFYCDASPRFRWTVSWEGAELERVLRSTVPTVLGVDDALVVGVRDVEVRRTGRSGRAAEIRIAVATGEIPIFGPDVRSVFRTPDGDALGSTAVQLESQQVEGRLHRLTAAGAGWGHGVGMCQWGAIGRARVGQDVRQILHAYFPGTRVERA